MPDRPPIVVSDTTPLIALAVIDQIGILGRLLVDDRLARAHLKRLGMPITGVVGVLLKAKRQRLIAEVGPLLSELRRGGIRLGGFWALPGAVQRGDAEGAEDFFGSPPRRGGRRGNPLENELGDLGVSAAVI
jgi:hypothetical protein